VSGLPDGVVTFLFSDIEGSTRLVKALRERYPQVLAEHRQLVRAAVAAHGGHEVDTQGDAFFVVFDGAKQAVLCALDVQRVLAAHRWPAGAPVRVRIGVHTGQAVLVGDGYTGLAVHRAARICAVARGGEVLISQATQAVVEDQEEEFGFTLVDAGEQRLKDLDRPVRLFRLAAPGLEMVPAAGGEAAVIAAGGMHGFPAVLTSFIGRDGPVAEVTGRLQECRLVTITGPGGAGKTRLASEVARRVADRFADGAWLVELAPLQDPALAAAAVATALGVREQPGEPAAGALARVLARQQLLLVLDNCEHVIGAAAALSAGLLSACDDVRILATSREPLAVAGEARYRLAPLALPDLDDVADAARAEAVALFADRARSADAQFALDDRSAPAVARLVTRLDGMPLAIELAAARVEALGVTQLLDRLGDRFALLAGRDRLAPSRQRSLAATVEWSYQLLDETERRVFRAVSVFPGPFTLDGAEAVAGPGAGAVVLRLVDCSLLVPPRAGADGRSRYGMLETLRSYGSAQLEEAGEQDGATAALAGWALRVAEEAAVGLETSTGELDAARWLDAEDATMQQVLAWAVAHEPATAWRLVAALGWWWYSRGWLPVVYPLLRTIAGGAEPGSDGWCTAQFWLGYAADDSADNVGALDHFTALLDALADRPPSRALAGALTGRAMKLLDTGRTAEGADEARRALAVAREVGYPAGEVLALLNLSITATACGDHDDAVRLARQAGQVPGGIPGHIARSCLWILARALTAAGDLAGAERVCAAGLAGSRDAGDLWNEASLLTQLARVDLRAGRVDEAAAHLREGLQISVRTGSLLELGTGLYACGCLCAATGRPAEVITMWAAQAALRRHEGSTDAPLDARGWTEPLREARRVLGDDRADAAQERGAAMSPATAAEYALMLTAPSPQPSDAPRSLGELSARERELVALVAQGRTDAEIAAQLFISVRTVGSHLDRIRDKTGCRRRADLTRLALSAGLI
jgi:predicted ATPase/class 3 adenylate cyclase/DNA-binding CsgD family transcriptional regulator